MPKLEEILKEKGYTEAELTALAPLLADQKFRATLETEYDSVVAARDKYKADADFITEWREKTAIPIVDQYAKDTVEAKAEAASLRARLVEAEKAGFAPAGSVPLGVVTPPVDAFDPKKHNLVTNTDLEAGYQRFANLEGDAIALAHDLGDQYRTYYPGQTLADYVGTDGKTGFRALLAEARAKGQNVGPYIAEKFNFAGKRNEMLAAQKQKERDAIAAEERAKVVAEYGHPGMRTPSASAYPLIPRMAKDQGNPWDNPSDRRSQRIQRAVQTEMSTKRN
jgi:hypothetical protein